MKNRLMNLICVGFLISSSPAFSDNHLDRTVKFQDGERYANCVYGETGEVTVKQEVPGAFFTTNIVDHERQCLSGWEGAFLYQAFVSNRANMGSSLWDLQTAYNCCVHTGEDRSKKCAEMYPGGAVTLVTSWGSCAEYLGTLLGNVANVLPVIQQPEANEAVKMACIRAILGNKDFSADENDEDLIKKGYHNRDGKLFVDCFKEEYLSMATPWVFDYLRDHTDCLWNNPDKSFCSGSRRRMPGTPYGWENDR